MGVQTEAEQQSTRNFCTTDIFINLVHEGVHCWPDCPIEEVSYLRHPHRHNFHIHMRKRVFHDDRDVEFIWWKHRVQEYLATLPYDLGRMSCEMFARDLYNRFGCTYVSVSEDGEAGAVVEQNVGLKTRLSWLAGIIDGEGSIIINRRSTKYKNGFVYACCVFVGNTDKRMIDLVSSVLGEIGVKACPTIYQSKTKCWNVMYNITVSKRSEIVRLLQHIYPYLITKRDRANLMLRWCNSRLEQEKKSPNHRDMVWTTEDEEVFLKMKELNKRGKKDNI